MKTLLEVARRFNEEILRLGARPTDLSSGELEDGSGLMFYVETSDGSVLTALLDLPPPPPLTSARLFELLLEPLLAFPRVGEPLQ